MLKKRQRRILKNICIESDDSKYSFWNNEYSNTDFDLVCSKYLFYYLKADKNDYFVSLYYITHWGWLALSSTIAFISMFFFLHDGMNGHDAMRILGANFLWSLLSIIPIGLYNLYNLKLVKKHFKLRHIKLEKKRKSKEKKADKFVNDLLSKNKKLERKIKLEEIEK